MSDSTHHPDHLTNFLADRDEPCPLCEYNLRGLTGDHCPECGKKLIVRVGLEDPAIGAYVAGLIGLACLFGFSILTLVWFTVMTILLGPGPPASLWVLLLILSLASGALLLAWIVNRARIRRQSRSVRMLLAALCLAAPVVGLGVFIALFVGVVD